MNPTALPCNTEAPITRQFPYQRVTLFLGIIGERIHEIDAAIAAEDSLETAIHG